MRLEAPQALLLAVPLALLWWRLAARGPARGLRLFAVVLLPLALARPVLLRGGDALDLVVVVDRSRSMPPGAEALAEELIGYVEDARDRPGRRVGVVSFGREARVERAPSSKARLSSLRTRVDTEASDLAAALSLAEELVAPGRAGRVLVLSDGLATGGDAQAAGRRLAARGIPIDFRHLARQDAAGEVAILDLETPASLAAGEAFHLGARLRSSGPREIGYRLLRDGVPIARGTARLAGGDQRLVFRDRLERPGLAEYRLELEGAADPVPENDSARALVRVEGRPRILVLREDGRPGALARSLEAAGLEVEVRRPGFGSLEALDGVAAVVLENLSAERLGDRAMRVLELYVRERGGGLLMTGGPDSFGTGGYLRSRLEGLLPVSLEMRKEQRRSRMALVITMDRSGSMSVATPGGRPKMALAAEGAVAALTLLTEGDEAAVWVVDERAHAIVPLTPIAEGLDLGKVASIQSMGGGIYVYEALESAALQAEASELPVRHIVLFADAADSEEPGQYQQLLADLARKRVTVSVIGLGAPTDADAPLLEDIARRGGGRVWFTDSADALPRLFAQETIVVARASFIDEPTAIAPGPDLALLGPAQLELTRPAPVGAYNLTWLRPGAGVAYRTADEAKAPVLALWQQGLGRVAAFTAEADGSRAASLLAWPGYHGLFGKLARWLMGPGLETGTVVRARRDGHEIEVVAEIDPGAEPWAGAAFASLLPTGGEGPVRTAPLRLDGEGRLTARFPLSSSASVLPVVRLGGEVLPAAPVTLPYPPEYAPSASAEGRRLLLELARLTGGHERLSVDGLFERGAGAPGRRDLAPWLVALALLALLAEVAARRLFADLRLRLPRIAWRRGPSRPRTVRSERPGIDAEAAPAPEAPGEAAAPEPDGDRGKKDDVTSALEAAAQRARSRLGR